MFPEPLSCPDGIDTAQKFSLKGMPPVQKLNARFDDVMP
jgi:hypothetical protein